MTNIKFYRITSKVRRKFTTDVLTAQWQQYRD